MFDANQSIQRFCKPCSTTTVWKQQSLEAQDDPPPHLDEPGKLQQESATAELPQARNKRKYARIQMKALACIRQSGFAEDIVECEDLSRGACASEVPHSTWKDPRLKWPSLIRKGAETSLFPLESHMSGNPRTYMSTVRRTLIQTSDRNAQRATNVHRVASIVEAGPGAENFGTIRTRSEANETTTIEAAVNPRAGFAGSDCKQAHLPLSLLDSISLPFVKDYRALGTNSPARLIGHCRAARLVRGPF